MNYRLCAECGKKKRDQRHKDCHLCRYEKKKAGVKPDRHAVVPVPLGLRQLLAEFHDDMDREKERGASVRG